ncbi:hypothetical protein ALC57_09247 [Trachymyrmex cornetzi]|uniref:Uncharacterized protein n=1 Tax=Trachymyrmex cornetzi TaxID=471704 RepID=A0A151J620_9HYME|nr:hypothetical protein ALC57_09247 [Trachymyrmex cornetzi]
MGHALAEQRFGRETEGAYMYLGIQKGLEKIILPDVYHENEISVLVHIDGMQIYNNSQIQVWPISIKIFNSNYICKSFVAGIYYGDSKPQNSNNYLNDFVKEAKNLINNGITLNGKRYLFKIFAIVADAIARAFIKNCKVHNTFYALYPEINCNLRNKESFENRQQPQHHKGDVDSILLELPNFDIINSVVIDSIHLLYLGVMKSLLEKWISKKSVAGLNTQKTSDTMNFISRDIPCEFQGKKFDIDVIGRWKATQFRFFLLFCSSTILHGLLPNDFYKHFLLLFVACRILNKQNITLLIHLADDVKNSKVSLSELSSFWGESYISIFKKLVKSPNKPLVQIINRLSELESRQTHKIKEKRYFANCVQTYIFIKRKNTLLYPVLIILIISY